MFDNYMATESGYPGGKSQSHWAAERSETSGIRKDCFHIWKLGACSMALTTSKAKAASQNRSALKVCSLTQELMMFQYCEKNTQTTHQHGKHQLFNYSEMLKQEAFPKMGVSRVTCHNFGGLETQTSRLWINAEAWREATAFPHLPCTKP